MMRIAMSWQNWSVTPLREDLQGCVPKTRAVLGGYDCMIQLPSLCFAKNDGALLWAVAAILTFFFYSPLGRMFGLPVWRKTLSQGLLGVHLAKVCTLLLCYRECRLRNPGTRRRLGGWRNGFTALSEDIREVKVRCLLKRAEFGSFTWTSLNKD